MGDREIVITRIIDAPRDLVFKAFIDQEHITEWWGPDGFSTTTEIMDVRPGGDWKSVMHGPDGTDYPNHFIYQEIVEPERLSYVHGDFDVNGTTYKGFKADITFEAMGEQTKVTLRTVFYDAVEAEKQKSELGAEDGGNQTLGRLAKYVEKK